MGFHDGGGFHGGFGGPGRQFTRDQEEQYERKVSDSILLKRLLIYVRPYKRRIAGLMAVLIVTSLMSLVTPLMTKIVLDVFIVPEMVTGETSMLNIWLLVMILLTVASLG